MQIAAFENMHFIERVARIILGYGLIFSVLFQPVPLDYLVVLPLIAIYPALTGILGWDPVYELFKISSNPQDQDANGLNVNKPGNAAQVPYMSAT